MDFLYFTDEKPAKEVCPIQKSLDAFYNDDNINLDNLSADDSIFFDFRKRDGMNLMMQEDVSFSNDSVSDFEGLLSRIDKVPVDIDFFSQYWENQYI